MSCHPVRASSRSLIDLLYDAMHAMLAPRELRTSDAAIERALRAPRYAAFDTPTYQRRGLVIPGLEAAGDPPVRGVSARPGLSPARSAGPVRSAASATA